MSNLINYLAAIEQMYQKIVDEEEEKIHNVAKLLSKSIVDGNIVHIFGTGHSEIVCKEMFTRAGNLSCFRIVGSHYQLEKFERLEGMALLFMSDYIINPDEVVIIVSSSGINALPIEVAMIAKEKGAVIVALTSLQHSKTVDSRHSSEKKLFEIADIVIDTHVPSGDAAIKLDNLVMKVGPVSSLANIFIMNSIVIETAELILNQGVTPPIRISRNLPGGDVHNQKFKIKYQNRIPELVL